MFRSRFLLIIDFPCFLAGLSLTYLVCLVLWIVAIIAALRRLLLARGRARSRPARIRWINAGLSVWFLLAGLTGVGMYYSLGCDQSDSFNITNVSNRCLW